MKILTTIFILVFLTTVASAKVELIPIGEIIDSPSFIARAFSKLRQCTWHVSCYWDRKLGTVSLTAITGTTLVSDLDTILSENLTTLNDRKVDVASTTWPQLTTATGLVSVGTLTTGALGTGFTAVSVAQGGTGSTTLAANLVLLGNGTGNVAVVSGTGSSGQFLTSNGAGTNPSWTTSAIDQAGTYAWTGRHTFAAQFGVGTNTPATGSAGIQGNLSVSATGYFANITATGTTKFNGVALTWPAGIVASSTLAVNSSGSVMLAGGGGIYFAASTTQITTPADTAENTTHGVQIPANLLGANGIITIRMLFDDQSSAKTRVRIKLAGTQLVEFQPYPEGSSGQAWAVVTIANRNSISSQIANAFVAPTSQAASSTPFATGAVDTSVAQNLSMTIEKSNTSAVNIEYFIVDITH